MSNQSKVKTNRKQHCAEAKKTGIDSNAKGTDSQEILIENNLNSKSRQALAKKLGMELILLSGHSSIAEGKLDIRQKVS